MENQKGYGGYQEIRPSGKCLIVPDPVSDEADYAMVAHERSLDDTDYYTSSDSIVGKNGVGAAVRALRQGFRLLLADHTDSRFTARLMTMASKVFQSDETKGKVKKSLFFSQNKSYLETLRFNIRKTGIDRLLKEFDFTHSDARSDATISVKGLLLKNFFIPGGASHYRILNHLSIISDYCYSKSNRRYEPMSMLNGMCVLGYSDYVDVGTKADIEVRVEFQDGVCPLEEDTVIQCWGVEFYQKSGEKYCQMTGGSGVSVYEVF